MNFASTILACAVCYGDSSSPMTQGLNWAIFVLLGVTAMVLGGVATVGWMFVRRARRVESGELEELMKETTS